MRLGGPYLTTLSRGTLLRVTGMRGGSYHVQLSPDCDGWVESRAVEWAPAGTPMPHLAFTDVSAYGNEQADLVAIPYRSPVPFAVAPTLSPAGRAAIEVDFYGAHNAATWISHRPTAKVVREVTIRQVGTDHLRLCIELKGKQLWGYKCEVTNNAVVLTIRRPPKLALLPDSPFQGLTIALEPGHGGDNSGARGVSGSEEKDVNRMAVAELARQFEAAGAKTVIVRKDDESPSLGERVRQAVAANADLFISVHANSAGHQRGYLSVSGTSTYYKWPFCRDLSEAIHARLLDITKLGDFGNVGEFQLLPAAREHLDARHARRAGVHVQPRGRGEDARSRFPQGNDAGGAAGHARLAEPHARRSGRPLSHSEWPQRALLPERLVILFPEAVARAGARQASVPVQCRRGHFFRLGIRLPLYCRASFWNSRPQALSLPSAVSRPVNSLASVASG